mmetsp:Transcript_53055/g.151122  ORF Transcript_53055/g.151122 Transcript_53055/m.151122 type:complete len:206 (-) Transcript_53055:207-824(-)
MLMRCTARQLSGPPLLSKCQITTSCSQAEANVSRLPSQAFQETSRAGARRSPGASSASASQRPRAAAQDQARTPPSPAVANRAPSRPAALPGSVRTGAHETALAWPSCAQKPRACQRCSTAPSGPSTEPWCSMTVALPSAEAQARTAPRSSGAQATARTGPCRSRSSLCTIIQPSGLLRRPQTSTRPSAPADASSTPVAGGAQDT